MSSLAKLSEKQVADLERIKHDLTTKEIMGEFGLKCYECASDYEMLKDNFMREWGQDLNK